MYPAAFAGALRLRSFAGPLRPRTPHQGVPPWTRYAKFVGCINVGISAYCLRKRNWYFHGHHKTKATAGNRASTFRQQPFVFPSALHPVGGIKCRPARGRLSILCVEGAFPGLTGNMSVGWYCSECLSGLCRRVLLYCATGAVRCNRGRGFRSPCTLRQRTASSGLPFAKRR